MSSNILQDKNDVIIPKSIFTNHPSGHGVVLTLPDSGPAKARLATSGDDWRDIFGWTGQKYDGSSSSVAKSGFLMLVDLLEDATYYVNSDVFGIPVYYRQSLCHMSLSKGSDGVLVGTMHGVRYLYDNSTYRSNDIQIRYNTSPSRTDPTTVDLDLTLVHDSTAKFPTKVGDLRLVMCQTEGAWDDDEELTVQGGGETLSTLEQGSAAMWELTSMTQDPNDLTWSTTWVAKTDVPFFKATVHLHPDLWRAQCAKRDEENDRDRIRAFLAATTTGAKTAWTVSSDAPTGTQTSDDGWLSVGGLQDGEVFKISAKESDSTVWDSKLVTKTSVASSWSLCDGNCIIHVGTKGIRVNQIASGAVGYTVTTKVWTLVA